TNPQISEDTSGPKRRRRRPVVLIAFICLLAVCGWGLLEVGSFFLYKRISGNPFQLSEIANRRAERVSQLDGYLSPKRESATKYIQHPFLGYVGRPGGLNWSGRQ